MTVRYQTPLQDESTTCRLLKRLNWNPPQQEFLLLAGHSDQLAKVDWLERYPLSDGYSIEPWSSHHADASGRLDAPQELKAAVHSRLIHPGISLALLHHNDLVGWMIGDRTDQTSIRYSTLHVSPNHRRRGQGLYLMASAFRRQHAENIPIARAAVADKSKAMLRLTKRHLHHHLSGMRRSMRSTIELQSVSNIKRKPLNG